MNWILRLVTLPAAEYVMPVLFPAVVRSVGDPIVRFLRHRGLIGPAVTETWSSYRSLTDAENRQAFVRTMRAVLDPGGQSVSAIDRLYLAAHVPTLIIWGDRDRIIPISHAYQAHDALPQSTLAVIEGAGHYPHVESPARFVAVLVDFLRSTQPAPPIPDGRGDLLRRGVA